MPPHASLAKRVPCASCLEIFLLAEVVCESVVAESGLALVAWSRSHQDELVGSEHAAEAALHRLRWPCWPRHAERGARTDRQRQKKHSNDVLRQLEKMNRSTPIRN